MWIGPRLSFYCCLGPPSPISMRVWGGIGKRLAFSWTFSFGHLSLHVPLLTLTAMHAWVRLPSKLINTVHGLALRSVPVSIPVNTGHTGFDTG